MVVRLMTFEKLIAESEIILPKHYLDTVFRTNIQSRLWSWAMAATESKQSQASLSNVLGYR